MNILTKIWKNKLYLYVVATVVLFVGVVISVNSSGIARATINDEVEYNIGVVDHLEVNMSMDLDLLTTVV